MGTAHASHREGASHRPAHNRTSLLLAYESSSRYSKCTGNQVVPGRAPQSTPGQTAAKTPPPPQAAEAKNSTNKAVAQRMGHLFTHNHARARAHKHTRTCGRERRGGGQGAFSPLSISRPSTQAATAHTAQRLYLANRSAHGRSRAVCRPLRQIFYVRMRQRARRVHACVQVP